MNILIVYLFLMSAILPPSELFIQNIYLRRISDAFIKMATKPSLEQEECKNNTSCFETQDCMDGICRDPCPGSCGIDATCHVVNHILSCLCPKCYKGDPHKECTQMQGWEHFTCNFDRLIDYLGGS